MFELVTLPTSFFYVQLWARQAIFHEAQLGKLDWDLRKWWLWNRMAYGVSETKAL